MEMENLSERNQQSLIALREDVDGLVCSWSPRESIYHSDEVLGHKLTESK